MPHRVMIVEGDLITAWSIEETLSEAGYGVSGVFHRGDDALPCLTETATDLVLLDVASPGSFEPVELARQLRKASSADVIYLAAVEFSGTDASLTHPLGYLIRPFDDSALIDSIATAVCRREMRCKATYAAHPFVVDASYLFTERNDLQGCPTRWPACPMERRCRQFADPSNEAPRQDGSSGGD